LQTRKRLSTPLATAAMLAFVSATAPARADITVYTDQAAFLAAVTSAGVDTYDDLDLQSYPDTLDRSAGAYDYQVYSLNALFGVGMPGDHWLSNAVHSAPIVFSNFSGGVHAFGGNFFNTDYDGIPMDGNVVLTAIDGTALTFTLEGATRSSFLGFVSSTPLSSVVLGTDGNPDWATADNVVLAVPEPATSAMLLAGIGLLGVAVRRRG
jgi:hypothetical protein